MTINDYFKVADAFKLIMNDSLAMAASDLDRLSVNGAMCFPLEDCLDYNIRLVIPYDDTTHQTLAIMDIPNSGISKLIQEHWTRYEELSLRTVLTQMPNRAISDAFAKFGRRGVAEQYPTIIEDLHKLSNMKKKVDQGGLQNE